MTKEKWIGFDFDGTLAEETPQLTYDPRRTGPPIPRMVRRAKKYLYAGVRIKILTARMSILDYHTVFSGTAEEYLEVVRAALDAWCLEHLGQTVELTCEKDYLMAYLYDDRAHRVVKNKGHIVGCDNCELKE